MPDPTICKVGVVGAASRGSSFATALAQTGFFRCQAVCDTHEAGLRAIQQSTGAPEAYLDYAEMLARSDIQAVFIGTPMPLHASMAIAALERGLHVLCEVTPAISLDECRRLVLAATHSCATYMLAENYTFTHENQLIKELVTKGLFGETYYAEGEYLHELKALNEATPWRRRWQTGINGITYGTHSLGPILQWMPGDRVVSVMGIGSGHHYLDPRGAPYENEDSCVLLAKTTRGALIKIRVDMLSDRPHAMNNYTLQGTHGAYESARSHDDTHRIWLRSRAATPDHWENLWKLEPEHTPELWRDQAQLAAGGHGGGDLLELLYWRDVILGRRENELGIHQAMDCALPGLISQQSILQGGAWLPVPNSRDWADDRKPPAQLRMRWPADRPAPDVTLPADYRLETFHDADADGLISLMHKAGFTSWDEGTLAGVRRSLLPGGLFVIRHVPTSAIVATANANHESSLYAEGGELGWVATDPAHAGRGLGRAVCSAVVARFCSAGFSTIFLKTDDDRLPAIKLYLSLGFEAIDDFRDDMPARWSAVHTALSSQPLQK